MVVKKQPDSSSKTGSIEADSLDWFQQFMKHLEINWSSVSQRIATNNDPSAYRLEVLRAVKLTLKDSGMDESSIQTAFAQVAFESPMQADVTGWTIEQNTRRFELIDRDIQGTLTATEQLELAALTQLMRVQVETANNQPTSGAKALHRFLLESDSSDEVS
jgi:hypothetical protein